MDKFLEMQTFAAVVDSGSFVKAADALTMSKAAVSRYVGDLESRLGVRVASLSKGMRQKVLLTSALLHDPDQVRHDAVELEILRRVDRGDAGLFEFLAGRSERPDLRDLAGWPNQRLENGNRSYAAFRPLGWNVGPHVPNLFRLGDAGLSSRQARARTFPRNTSSSRPAAAATAASSSTG